MDKEGIETGEMKGDLIQIYNTHVWLLNKVYLKLLIYWIIVSLPLHMQIEEFTQTCIMFYSIKKQ